MKKLKVNCSFVPYTVIFDNILNRFLPWTSCITTQEFLEGKRSCPCSRKFCSLLHPLLQQPRSLRTAQASPSLRSYRKFVSESVQGHNQCLTAGIFVTDNNIRIISCSATLANPAEYMSKLFNLDQRTIEVVENDGAPSGGKDYLLWNPPFIDEMDPSLGRKSSLSEASMLFRLLVKKGVRVIVFCKVRPRIYVRVLLMLPSFC